MKKMKRLLSLGLALMLTFCALSADMVVHADDQAKISDAFASLKVNGTDVDLEKCPDRYVVVENTQDTAKIEWQLKDGWTIGDAILDGNSFQSGATITISTSISSTAYIYANGPNDQTVFYEIHFACGEVKPSISTLWAGAGTQELTMENLFLSDLPVVSLTSSKSGVIKVKQGATTGECKLTPKKPGKSTITVVVRINGEEKTFSNTLKVLKYPNALKSLKVAGKKVNFKKKPFSCSAKGKKVKIEFKLAKGWMLLSSGYVHNDGKSEFVTLKSGKTVKVSKKGTVAYVYAINQKGNIFNYIISLKR